MLYCVRRVDRIGASSAQTWSEARIVTLYCFWLTVVDSGRPLAPNPFECFPAGRFQNIQPVHDESGNSLRPVHDVPIPKWAVDHVHTGQAIAKIPEYTSRTAVSG